MISKLHQWWVGIPKESGKRLSRKQRLNFLQIIWNQFVLYKTLFLTYRRTDTFAIRKDDGSWPQFPYPWDDSQILRHLCGHSNVGIPFGDLVDQIVLDIDTHGGRSRNEAIRTAKGAKWALQGEPIIYQSSESEGIRMIWFLKKPVSREDLNNRTEAKLKQTGVKVEPGKCEVRLGTEVDRLPFGRNSMLLDPVTFDPMTDLSLSETLKYVENNRQQHAIDVPPDLPSEALADEYNNSDKQPSHFNDFITQCLETGLPPDITTNDCLLKLAWHGRVRKGLNDDQLRIFLQDWATSKHNGNSNRINNNDVQSVYNQIDRIIADQTAMPGSTNRNRLRLVGLSADDINTLMSFPGSFKLLKGAHNLLTFAKGNHTFHPRLDLSVGDGTYKRQSQQIDLPVKLLRILKVPNANNTSGFISDMKRLGILAPKRKAWPAGHKARQYWVNFEFDLQGQPLSTDFDLALWSVLGYDGISDRFTRYHANRIQARVANNGPAI